MSARTDCSEPVYLAAGNVADTLSPRERNTTRSLDQASKARIGTLRLGRTPPSPVYSQATGLPDASLMFAAHDLRMRSVTTGGSGTYSSSSAILSPFW